MGENNNKKPSGLRGFAIAAIVINFIFVIMASIAIKFSVTFLVSGPSSGEGPGVGLDALGFFIFNICSMGFALLPIGFSVGALVQAIVKKWNLTCAIVNLALAIVLLIAVTILFFVTMFETAMDAASILSII